MGIDRADGGGGIDVSIRIRQLRRMNGGLLLNSGLRISVSIRIRQLRRMNGVAALLRGRCRLFQSASAN